MIDSDIHVITRSPFSPSLTFTPFYIDILIQYVQLDANGNMNRIGYYNTTSNIAYIDASTLHWKSSDNQPQVSYTFPASTDPFNNNGTTTMLVLICVAIGLVALLMLFFFLKRNHPVVIKASYLFLQIMLFGLLLFGIGIAVGLYNGTATCEILIWFAQIGLGLVFG